jgi:glutaredoxin
MKIDIITADWCGTCLKAKRLLAEYGYAYNEVDLDLSLGIMSLYNLKTVPQIFVDSVLLGGYEDLLSKLNKDKSLN